MDEESKVVDYREAARKVMEEFAQKIGLTLEQYEDKLYIGFDEFYE